MRKTTLLAGAALATALALPVQAGSIGDAFRAFVDKLLERGHDFGKLDAVRSWQEWRTAELTKRVDKLPLGRDETALFVRPGCVSCRAAEAYLRKQGGHFEVFDVTRDEQARQAFALAGGKGFPVLLVGNYRLTGWSERLYKDAWKTRLQDQIQSQQGSGA